MSAKKDASQSRRKFPRNATEANKVYVRRSIPSPPNHFRMSLLALRKGVEEIVEDFKLEVVEDGTLARSQNFGRSDPDDADTNLGAVYLDAQPVMEAWAKRNNRVFSEIAKMEIALQRKYDAMWASYDKAFEKALAAIDPALPVQWRAALQELGTLGQIPAADTKANVSRRQTRETVENSFRAGIPWKKLIPLKKLDLCWFYGRAEAGKIPADAEGRVRGAEASEDPEVTEEAALLQIVLELWKLGRITDEEARLSVRYICEITETEFYQSQHPSDT